MTIEALLELANKEPNAVERMLDEELIAYLSPYFPITRPTDAGMTAEDVVGPVKEDSIMARAIAASQAKKAASKGRTLNL